MSFTTLLLSYFMPLYFISLGSSDGAVVRSVASHLAQCHMWVEFVVGSRVAPRVFLPPQKPTSLNYDSTRTENLHENQLRLIWLALKL